jgi:perosamine synthetase
MSDKLALLGGTPSITMEQDHFTQWPIYGEEEAQVAAELIRNHGLSSTRPGGPIIELEQVVARRWGVKFAIAHSSGTAALRAALFGAGVLPGDEVIVQSAVHPYACLPIIGCGAIPVFADLDPQLTTLDPLDVERRITPKTKAVIVVHWNGMPVDMDAMLELGRRHNIKVIEDNCVSQGTQYRGNMCGSMGDAGGISFQDGKLTSAGEGGVLITNDEELYQRAATLGHYERLNEMPDPKYRGVSGFCFGEKYRMATLTAAIGCEQMKKWDQRVMDRRANSRKLGAALEQINGFSAPEVPDYVDSPYDRGHICFDPDQLGGLNRETLVKALQAEGGKVTSAARKDTRIPHTDLPRALHMHPVFAGNDAGTGEILPQLLGPAARDIASGPGTLPVTEDPESPPNTLMLPSFTRPADELIAQYVHAFEKVAAQADELAASGGK